MTIEIDGENELIKIAQQNGWTIDYDNEKNVLNIIDDDNGNEWTFDRGGNLTTSALDTDRIGNTHLRVSSDKTAVEVNSLIDKISTDEDGNGGTITFDSDVTVTVTSEDNIWLKSDVLLDFNGALVRLADNLNDDAPKHGLITVENEYQVENAHVRNVELDGNVQNNSSFSNRLHRQGIHCIGWKLDSNNDRTFGHRPRKCTFVNIDSHDTIASNFLFGGENCHAENLWLENSGNDHWLYCPAPLDCTVKNVHCSGYARSEGVLIGTSQGEDNIGLDVEDLYIEDFSHSPVTGPNMIFPLRVRPPADGSTLRDVTLRNVHIRPDDNSERSSVGIAAPTTIDRLVWRGAHGGGTGVLTVSPDARGRHSQT